MLYACHAVYPARVALVDCTMYNVMLDVRAGAGGLARRGRTHRGAPRVRAGPREGDVRRGAGEVARS